MSRRILRSFLCGVALLVALAPGVLAAPPSVPVNVVNSPAVTVGNAPANPVPVSIVSDGMQPFQEAVDFVLAPGAREDNATFVVPAGKRLVIEHFSAIAQGPTGQRYLAWVRTTVNAVTPSGTYLVFSQQMAAGGVDVYTATQPMRVYADPGTTVYVFFSRGFDDTGFCSFNAAISGYFVDQ
jgi:hypothetical protein